VRPERRMCKCTDGADAGLKVKERGLSGACANGWTEKTCGLSASTRGPTCNQSRRADARTISQSRSKCATYLKMRWDRIGGVG
jgi:hypothetical protein